MVHARSATHGTTKMAKFGHDVPSELAHLIVAVDATRSMLDVPDNWDGEGSPGINETTWQRAVDFLVGNALRIWEERGVVIPAPKVRKGPLGSIDLHWRTPSRELLINLPAIPGATADFYGDDGVGGQVVRGMLDPAREGQHLLLWLTT